MGVDNEVGGVRTEKSDLKTLTLKCFTWVGAGHPIDFYKGRPWAIFLKLLVPL